MFYPGRIFRQVISWIYFFNGIVATSLFSIVLYLILSTKITTQNKQYRNVQLLIAISAQIGDLLSLITQPIACTPRIAFVHLSPIPTPYFLGLALNSLYMIDLSTTVGFIYYSLFYRLFSLNPKTRKEISANFNKIIYVFFGFTVSFCGGLIWFGWFTHRLYAPGETIDQSLDVSLLQNEGMAVIFKEDQAFRTIFLIIGLFVMVMAVTLLLISAYYILKFHRHQSMAAAVFIVVPMTFIMLVDAGVPFLPEIVGAIGPLSVSAHSTFNSLILLIATRSYRMRIQKILRFSFQKCLRKRSQSHVINLEVPSTVNRPQSNSVFTIERS